MLGITVLQLYWRSHGREVGRVRQNVTPPRRHPYLRCRRASGGLGAISWELDTLPGPTNEPDVICHFTFIQPTVKPLYRILHYNTVA
jgi:hypothetical protein